MYSPLKLADEIQSQKFRSIRSCYYHRSGILKSKKNIHKPKCRKALKKKLKKYKLRKDGKEDPDILDVSKVLVSSLIIKSPNNIKVTESSCFNKENEFTPRNYLFKMVRRKKSSIKSDMNIDKDIREPKSIESIPDLPFIDDTKTQDIKQMNAFKLMMDSRNKSIGTNSPGKEKGHNESELSETIRKKELKAKRHLCLEKMAQEKGSINNKEIEEFREECVKTQMLKRAERLKFMIGGHNSKPDHKGQSNVKNLNKCLPDDSKDINVVICENNLIKDKGTLKLFNFLSKSDSHGAKNNVQNITEEEDDFLNKLSPSIRKKENMLSYFKKVPKDEDLDTVPCQQVLKVKITPKRKNKTKKPEKSKPLQIFNNEEEFSSNMLNISKSREKRKREYSDSIGELSVKENETLNESNNNGRPKRNSKKPIKYTDMVLTSSDEELHIFTPKKKRNEVVIEIKPSEEKNDVLMSVKISDSKQKKKKENDKNISKHKDKLKEKNLKQINSKPSKPDSKKKEQDKNIKLASIFVVKPQQNPFQLEARQKFLKSGVPETLKIKTRQCSTILPNNIFHTVVHVQQNKSDIIAPLNNWFQFNEFETLPTIDISNNLFEQLLDPVNCHVTNTLYTKQKPGILLKNLKSIYPKFPVYRTYNILKSKSEGELKECHISDLDDSVEIINCITDTNSENPERLSWNDKYKATSSKQILGNFESIKEIKRWLESWTETVKNKNNHSNESDLSDFCFSDTDTDSKDTFRHSNNILVITGPVGTGKTASVYAVAAELAIKVIEVNASSKRTGKIMLQDLQEATQSHKVNRDTNRIDSSQKSQEEKTTQKKRKKRVKPIKTYERHKNQLPENTEKEALSQQSDKHSQESSRTGMSLILIDDADIVFDQDDGFCSAVSQLIQCSKRPVILITSSLTCSHLQKFLMCGKIIKLQPLLPRMLGTWLDIMCLADTSFCYAGLGSKMLNHYCGDIRKTINFLQYFMISDKYFHQVEDQTLSQVTNTYKMNIDDENSSLSWADSDMIDTQVKKVLDTNAMTKYLDIQVPQTSIELSRNVFNAWCSMSSLMENEFKKESNHLDPDMNLKSISKTLDSISFIDCLNSKQYKHTLDISSRPWESGEEASVLENESLDCYDKSNEVIIEISNELIRWTSTVSKCISVHPPSMCQQRERNKVVARHKTLTTHLQPASSLDRRALALDYWPFCRTICRVEKTRTDINIKRHNRFCHYMKSVNVLCKNEFFDSLSESLC